MDHRKQNRDGYKKIYPMSLSADDSFCHYCGRSTTPELQLQWDHVPALNVRIPEEYGIEFDIRKTLVRSCSECNLLASDIPHLDYLERHLWLKARYLRRYKSVLTNTSPEDKDEVTDIAGKISSIGFHALLTMLGFGLKEESQIDSPIMEVKNKPSKRKIKNLIAEHLTGSPHEHDDAIEPEQEVSFSDEESETESKETVTVEEVKEFILDEWRAGNKISSFEDVCYWIDTHPSRAFGLGFEYDRIKHLEDRFVDLVQTVSEEYTSQKLDELEDDDEEAGFVVPQRVQSNEANDAPCCEKKIIFRKKSIDYRSWLSKNNTEIIFALMNVIEGRMGKGALLSENEFLQFIAMTGMGEKTYQAFLKHIEFRAYQHFFPASPEIYYGISVPDWHP